MDYFYDGQIRRFLLQFAKIFSWVQITKGKDPAGNLIYMRVPIVYGDSSRQVAAINADNSPSNLPSAPMISYYIHGFEYDQKRTMNPTYVETTQVRQRMYNENTNTFGTTQGQGFTVDRLMPVPYTLRVTVDFWTTNTLQKHELLEQLGPLFNPALEIQSTDNFLDWTSLSAVFQDGLTISSRTIPQGSDNAIDVMTWKFYMPIYLTTPMKLKKRGVIQKVMASVYQGDSKYSIEVQEAMLSRQKITPYGYNLMYTGNTLQLLEEQERYTFGDANLEPLGSSDTTLGWTAFLNAYGTIRPGISQIWLQNPYMTDDIVGTIVVDPMDDRLLIFEVDTDTLPQDTLDPVDSVVNPMVAAPDHGLPSAVTGRRYLLVDNIGSIDDATLPLAERGAWWPLIANANDIIEYDGSSWVVSFDSQAATVVQFCTNLTSTLQYRFIDGAWMRSVEGFYAAGDFSIVI